MKKAFWLLIILIGFSFKGFSQEQKTKPGIKPALLVIDIQNAFLGNIPESERTQAMSFINGYIDLFRKNGCPVIRVYHESKEYGVLRGSDMFEFPKTVSIKTDDPIVIKTYPDGFNKTDLDKVIKETGSNTLFLCGLSAVGCVLSTWIGAQNHDYPAFLIKDAIMSHNTGYTDNIEEMFYAVSYDVVKLVVENSGK